MLAIIPLAGLLFSACGTPDLDAVLVERGLAQGDIEPTILGAVSADDKVDTTTALPSGWKSYSNSQHGYRAGYPDAWAKEERSSFGITSFFDPRTGVSIDIGVAATRQTDLTSYVQANKISSTEGATYLHQGPITVNGVQGYELILTLPSEFFSQAFRPALLKHRQVVFISRGKAYVMTATALEEEYDQYADTFDTFVTSFVVPRP